MIKVSNQALQAYGRATTSSTGATTQTGGASQPPVLKPQGTDPAQVSISAEARALASASSAYDPDKVAAIKSQIANGTYSINPEQIANRMIDESA